MRVCLAVAPMIIGVTLSTAETKEIYLPALFSFCHAAKLFLYKLLFITENSERNDRDTHVYCGMSGPLSWRTRLESNKRQTASLDFRIKVLAGHTWHTYKPTHAHLHMIFQIYTFSYTSQITFT
jgi:hypothetical protein